MNLRPADLHAWQRRTMRYVGSTAIRRRSFFCVLYRESQTTRLPGNRCLQNRWWWWHRWKLENKSQSTAPTRRKAAFRVGRQIGTTWQNFHIHFIVSTLLFRVKVFHTTFIAYRHHLTGNVVLQFRSNRRAPFLRQASATKFLYTFNNNNMHIIRVYSAAVWF